MRSGGVMSLNMPPPTEKGLPFPRNQMGSAAPARDWSLVNSS